MKHIRLTIILVSVGSLFSACNTTRFYANKRINHSYEIEKEVKADDKNVLVTGGQEELSTGIITEKISEKSPGKIDNSQQPEAGEINMVTKPINPDADSKVERNSGKPQNSPVLRIKKHLMPGAVKETKDATKGGGILMIILSLLLAGLALLFHGLLGIMGLIFFFIFGLAACIVFITGIVYLIIGD
jgi:hypothetical protein